MAIVAQVAGMTKKLCFPQNIANIQSWRKPELIFFGERLFSGNRSTVEPLRSTPSDNESFQFQQGDTELLFTPVPHSEPPRERTKQSIKVTVVGVGNVGMACAQTMLTLNVIDELALVDVQEDKLKGEMLDLQHGAAFLPRTRIRASTDYSVTAGSDLCVVTAGARQRDGESRLSLVGRNVNLLKSIIPQLTKYSPETTLMLVSNPVDISSWAAWKISGFPSNRVIGTGTNLDSSRFRFLIGDALSVNAQNVHGYILGEHGDSSVPYWSSVSVGGIPLVDFFKSRGHQLTPEVLKSIHKTVVEGAYNVIKLKGYTNWAIGYSTAALANSILRDQRRIHPVSVLAQGFYGIKEEVFLSLPCILGHEGVVSVANSLLHPDEESLLRESASKLWEVQSQLDI